MIAALKNTLWAGVGALLTLAATTAVTEVVGGPIKVRVGEAVAGALGHKKSMRVYSLEPGKNDAFTHADAEYLVSLIGTGEIDGDVTVFEDQHEVTSQRSELIGYMRDDALSFSFQSTRVGTVGVGSYFGGFDSETGNYVGILTAYAHDPHGLCTVTKFVAVVGDADNKESFLALANTAREENLLPAVKPTTLDLSKRPSGGCGGDKPTA